MMLKIVIGFLLTLLAITAVADHNFCCSDNNWQQEMLHDYNTPENRIDFSYPAGSFRAVCSQCQYDFTRIRCLCNDSLGRPSYVPTELTVGNCQNIYADSSGILQCGG